MIEKVLDLLRRVSLMHEMQTLIIVSHDIESALAISDTALVLAPAPAIPDPQQPDRLYFRDGATITHTIDLAARGLAFQENIRDNPAFRETVREVRNSI
jgi:ABC-type nitrate/sulfonate/bicarbonate transport system ATPase subunit